MSLMHLQIRDAHSAYDICILVSSKFSKITESNNRNQQLV